MGWLTKILKGSSSGSSHRVSEGRNHERYENDEKWEEPPTTVVLSHFLYMLVNISHYHLLMATLLHFCTLG